VLAPLQASSVAGAYTELKQDQNVRADDNRAAALLPVNIAVPLLYSVKPWEWALSLCIRCAHVVVAAMFGDALVSSSPSCAHVITHNPIC